MSSVFSAISGVFGRAMIIGVLLPATLFVVFGYLILIPMLPWEWPIVARLEALEPEGKIAVVGALAVVLAGLLDILNIPIVRFYEGYPWEDGLLGRLRKRCQLKRFDEQVTTRRRTGELRAALRAVDPRDPRIEPLYVIQDDIDRDMMALYPERDLILPTRLGNVIRSFEEYPRRQYGISAVVLWPRFIAQVSQGHAQQMEDARTSFNVTIHLSFLAAVAALLLLAAGCAYPIPFVSWSLMWPWLLRIVIAAAVSWFMYVASIGRASAWGETVRAAFDQYRGAVMRDFGVSPMPRDLRSERSVWQRLSQHVIFGDQPDVGPVLRFDTATMVVPNNNDLVITRGAAATSTPGVREITVRVENRGPFTAEDVQLVEHLPAGTELVWCSPTKPVAGANPYYFALGNIASTGSAFVSYRILAPK